MRSQAELARLYAARKALAALIVHDGLPLHSAYQQIDREIEQKPFRSVIDKARKLLGEPTPVVAAEPVPAPAPEPIEATPAPAPAPEPAAPAKTYAGQLLSTKEAAAMLGVTPGALEMDRSTAKKNNRPPRTPFVVAGARVFYRLRDLEARKAKTARPDKDVLTTAEAADALAVKPEVLRRDRHIATKRQQEPRVPFVKPDRQVIYRRADLEKILAESPKWLHKAQHGSGKHPAE